MELFYLAIGVVAIGLFVHWAREHCMDTTTSRNHTVYYRTKDGRADYGFSFKRQSDGSYRAYIVSQPSYGSRDTSLYATHRLMDRGRYYVCWEPPPRNEADVRQVAALWADNTQDYIKTGRHF